MNPQQRRRISWWHLLLGFLALNIAIFAACGVGAWWWVAQSARAVDKEVERIRAAGEPAMPEDLNALPGPPAESDVTEMLIPILAQFETPDFQQDSKAVPIVGAENQQPIPPVGQPWPDLESAEAFLARYEPEMKALHKAMDRGGAANFPQDFREGYKMLLPNVQRLRAAARMLVLEAHVRAHRGDAAGAAESIHRLLILDRALENEPILVSQLVRIAISSMGIHLIEEMLPRVDFSQDDLSLLRDELRKDGFEASLTQALLGERVMGIQAIRNPAMLLEEGQEAKGSLLTFGTDAMFYLDTMRKAIDASKMPFPQALQEARQIEAESQGDDQSQIWRVQRTLSFAVLPAMSATFTATARIKASRDAADVAIAAELYRRKHGELPESLAELAPEFLSAVPTDPYDGQPLRYRRTERGCMIYSVGKDGVDNSGKGSLSDDPDIVFKLERD